VLDHPSLGQSSDKRTKKVNQGERHPKDTAHKVKIRHQKPATSWTLSLQRSCQNWWKHMVRWRKLWRNWFWCQQYAKIGRTLWNRYSGFRHGWQSGLFLFCFPSEQELLLEHSIHLLLACLVKAPFMKTKRCIFFALKAHLNLSMQDIMHI